MITGYVRISELAGVTWPNIFYAVPRIGELIESIDGNHTVIVTRITHCAFGELERPYVDIYVEIVR